MAEEDFDLASLATHLHLTPDQVRKMAERDRIPGRRVAGIWRFSPAEIHRWLEDKIGVSDDKELTEMEKVLEQQVIHEHLDEVDLAALLPPERIFIPLQARTKNSVINSICELTSVTGALWEPDKMADALRSREELHPTALDNGVALLHPRRPIPGIMGETFLSLGVSQSGIPFGGPRGSLTDVFFLLGSINEAIHLRLLARISRLLQISDFLPQLRNASSPIEAHEILTSCDIQL